MLMFVRLLSRNLAALRGWSLAEKCIKGGYATAGWLARVLVERCCRCGDHGGGGHAIAIFNPLTAIISLISTPWSRAPCAAPKQICLQYTVIDCNNPILTNRQYVRIPAFQAFRTAVRGPGTHTRVYASLFGSWLRLKAWRAWHVLDPYYNML